MWTDSDSPGCKYDTKDCDDCGNCKPSPLDERSGCFNIGPEVRG